ncbi:MAG: MarR family transcriptional regulator [Roseimicrobium sp.]
MATANGNKLAPVKDPGKVADFILFSQREFLLNLSKDLSRGNVSYAQFFLLNYLGTSRELTMTDIARKMGHSTAAATGLVDRLEKLGYVERMHAADDRRKVLVRITQKGIELVAKLRAALQQRVAEAMHESSSYDVDSLVANYKGDMVGMPN